MSTLRNFFCLVSLLLVILSCQPESSEEIKFSIPAGFTLDEIYQPSESSHGSWVSIAEGPNGKFFTCDQYGDVFSFQMPPIGETLDSLDVDSIDLDIGFAHGLLWAFESLYVVVVNDPEWAKPGEPTSGVYKLDDTDGDGELDDQKKILDLDGRGEHGPHTLRVSPDQQHIYLIAGNFNTVPDHFKSKLPRNWGEDNLFPAYLDARGHANDITAPGGWVARTNPEGSNWELVAAGFRNPFSFGFNQDGELFAYDADMEWDFGMPWYRPTRILHVVSGAEFGWRTGSGKWPVYYPDNLPSVVNLNQGSPTAVIMGKDLQFPSRYRNGLFACDWSFGTMYYVDLQEKGSSYTASHEEFFSGIPLPISNATAGSDGHLYFLTGGRRLTSHLYRLRYTGEESVDPIEIANGPEKELRALRRTLESSHQSSAPTDLSKLWTYLDHSDQHIRNAARIALEHKPLQTWKKNIWTEKSTQKIIQATIAYARSGGQLNNQIVNKLNDVEWNDNSVQDQLALLRAYSLLLIRNETVDKGVFLRMQERLATLYPSTNDDINRELSQILIKLNDPDAVKKTIALLKNSDNKIINASKDVLSTSILNRSEDYGPQIKDMLDNMPPTESIHYALVLSHATEGWTKSLREDYFNWFEKAFSKKGGMSYKAFLDNMRSKALDHVPAEQKDYFKEKSGFYSPLKDMASIAQPIGPGASYNHYALWGIVGNDELEEYSGSFQQGERAYEAALCGSCHRMKGEGGSNGPDLSNIHTRFKKNEIIDAILVPNEAISDQYAFTKFNLKNGDVMSGRVLKNVDDKIEIYQSPYDPTQTSHIAKEDIESQVLSSISPMPAKLLNRLNEQEILDLFVYLLSGADSNHEYYTGESSSD